MALLNPGTIAQAQPSQEGKKPDGDKAAFKAKKLEALKRFKEKRAAQAKEAYEAALALRDELAKANLMDKLSNASREFIVSLCRDPAEKRAASGFGSTSVFTQMFGDKPVVGQEITLEEAFHKTFKGKSTLDVWVKRWVERGIIVDIVLDTANMSNTKYIIKQLP
jgi:hypothetical protein